MTPFVIAALTPGAATCDGALVDLLGLLDPVLTGEAGRSSPPVSLTTPFSATGRRLGPVHRRNLTQVLLHSRPETKPPRDDAERPEPGRSPPTGFRPRATLKSSAPGALA